MPFLNLEAYLVACQLSMMELLRKIVNREKSLNIFANSSNKDVWRGPKQAPELCNERLCNCSLYLDEASLTFNFSFFTHPQAKVSVFWVFLIRIFLYSDWIRVLGRNGLIFTPFASFKTERIFTGNHPIISFHFYSGSIFGTLRWYQPYIKAFI